MKFLQNRETQHVQHQVEVQQCQVIRRRNQAVFNIIDRTT